MQLDVDRIAYVVKLALVAQGKSQTELAQRIGIDRSTLNRFLNRKLNLLPQHIEVIITELNLWEVAASSGCFVTENENHLPAGSCICSVDAALALSEQ